MGDAQRSHCHRTGHLCDLGARTACRQRRAQRRQKYDRKQQRRIARGRSQRSPALTQRIVPELLEQWAWMRGICDAQRTEGVIRLRRERGFQRRRAECLRLLGRNVIGVCRLRTYGRQRQRRQQRKQKPLHRHAPIMAKNVRSSGSAA